LTSVARHANTLASKSSKPMLKVNTNDLPECSWTSPKGQFGGFGKEVSEALGRKPDSTDLMQRHPFRGYYDGGE
jgi:hypothetical protein